MNHLDRFLNTMRFKPVDHVPFWFPWYPERNWLGQPARCKQLERFQCDEILDVDVGFGFCPYFDQDIIDEDEESTTHINFEGVKMRELRANIEHGYAMPQFLEYPVKSREDFGAHKWRLQLNESVRFPSDWEGKCRAWQRRVKPLRWWGSEKSRREAGFFGPLRTMMGLEALSYAFYDDPGFVEEMMDNRADLIIAILERGLADTDIDFFVFWEDMAYKGGSLLSPQLFKRFMMPRYRRVTDLLRSRGVDIIIVDCDGDISQLIPLWLEAGVNGMLPFEVQSGMDVVQLRREYGNDLLMIGGIDKRAIVQGRSAIDAEIRRISPIIAKGGYVPFPDHEIPLEAEFQNVVYFLEKLEDVILGG